MIALVLAAGYGTRLLPLTRGLPKALLEIDGMTLLERVLRDIKSIGSVRQTVVVSNALYFNQLRDWVESEWAGDGVSVISDGTLTAEARLGAIGDIAFAIREMSLDDDLLVVASDCLIEFPLKEFARFFIDSQSTCIVVKPYGDKLALVEGAAVCLDAESNVTCFEEKPSEPKSNLGAFPIYLYSREVLVLFEEFLREGRDSDSPGRFPEWLYRRAPVAAFVLTEGWDCFDVGTPSGYAEVSAVIAARKAFTGEDQK